MRPLRDVFPRSTMVRWISELFVCGVTILLIANDGAALSIARKNDPELLPGSGLKMTPTPSIDGASSFKNDSHLAPSDGSNGVRPVTVGPGRDRLFTYPIPTGSLTLKNTTGILVASRCRAAIDVFEPARMTAGRIPINSLASARVASVSPPEKRYWISTFGLDNGPPSFISLPNVVVNHLLTGSSARVLNNTPIRGACAGCCARIDRGHPAAPTTITLMKSRRLM